MRQAMIKEQVFPPGILVVAISALSTLGAAVRIVVLVAFTARRQRFRFEQRLDVTG